MNEHDDVGESPLIDTRFQPGESGNKAGRPKGSKNKPRSKMRTTLERLYSIQDVAIEIIGISLTGKDSKGNDCPPPSKDKVDMSKFVVKAIESLNNTCLREEMNILGVREKNAEHGSMLAENQADNAGEKPDAFSMDMEPEPVMH